MQKEFLNDFYKYIEEFKYFSMRMSNIPWIYRTLLYLPIGACMEFYWLHKMKKCNNDYKDKYLKNEN